MRGKCPNKGHSVGAGMDLKGFTVLWELPKVEEAAKELWVRFANHITRLGIGPRVILATAILKCLVV